MNKNRTNIIKYLKLKGWQYVYVETIKKFVWVKGVYIENTIIEAYELQQKWNEEEKQTYIEHCQDDKY